jgi:hypothetical protein
MSIDKKPAIGALNDDSRAKRRPVRETLAMLHAAGGQTREGYVRRWVEDRRTSSVFGSRIEELKALGYELVNNEELGIDGQTASRLGSLTHKKEKNGQELYLMEIPLDIYDEIQAIKREKIVLPEPLKGEGIATDAKFVTKTNTNPLG